MGLNRSRFQKSISFQYLDPYYTPDGVSRGFGVFAREIDSPFNVSDFCTTSYGASYSISYPISEVSGIGFDLGYTHTELSAGLGSVQEIVSSPALFTGVDHYCLAAGETACLASRSTTAGELSDAGIGTLENLRELDLANPDFDRLQLSPDRGFVDKYGNEFDNFTLTSNWYRSTLNRGQLPTAGTLHNLGLELTLPGSDLEYARLSYTGQFYWPLTRTQDWVLALRTNLGFGLGYGGTDEMPFFNNYFAGGLSAAGVLRGFEENSLGPRSTPGARYNTVRGVRLLRMSDLVNNAQDGASVTMNADGCMLTRSGEAAQAVECNAYYTNSEGEGVVNNNSYAYRTETVAVPVLDADGNPRMEPVTGTDGNPLMNDDGSIRMRAVTTDEVRLAVERFTLDEDFDSFGGNILTTATLELLFPLPFLKDRSRVRSAFFN